MAAVEPTTVNGAGTSGDPLPCQPCSAPPPRSSHFPPGSRRCPCKSVGSWPVGRGCGHRTGSGVRDRGNLPGRTCATAANASVTTAAINSSSTYTHTCANAAHHPRRSTHSRSEHKLYSRKALGCRSWKNRCTCCSGFRYMASAPADGNPIARTCVTPAHRA